MAIHEAASASYANVASAYALCSAGDTLLIPAGSSSWSSTLTITIPITIDGTGVTLSAGTLSQGFFRLSNIESSQLMRITGITFTVTGGSHLSFTGCSLSQFRLDHCSFTGGTTMEIGGCKGVIDHCYFYNQSACFKYTAGTRAQADAAWESLEAGTSDAMFVEDNHFIYDANYPSSTNDHMIDTFNGGRLVIRYNDFDTDNLASGFSGQVWLIQTHGSAAGGASPGYWQANSGARRGQSIVEMYNNTAHGKNLHRLATIRGSANLIHDNVISTLTSGYQPCVVLMMEEEWTDSSNWSPLRTSWPAEDQVHNSFLWDNTFDGSAQTNSNFSGDSFVVKDRDFFLHRPATIGEGMTLGKETFTGSNGASNTYPTNGSYYPTYGTMEFTPDVENAYYGYVPYTYPHPLTLGEDAMLYGQGIRLRF